MEEDERLNQIENERLQKETEIANIYNNQINSTQDFYKEQQKQLEADKTAQENIIKERETLQEQQIKQQEEKVKKEATEQKIGAYGEYKQTVDDYGAQAEQLAEQGFSRAGVSETANTFVYQAYLTRKSEINKTVSDAILTYQNQLAEAKMSNNEKLVEIASNTLKQKMSLALTAFNTNNQLLLEKQQQLQSINDNYYNRKQNTIAQITAEKQEEQRQKEWLEEFREKQAEREMASNQWREDFNLRKQQYAIENAQAERDYQLALSKEKNSSFSNPSNNGLSEYAQTLYNKYSVLKDKLGYKNVLANKNVLRNYISNEAYKLNITENDANILWSMLGLN